MKFYKILELNKVVEKIQEKVVLEKNKAYLAQMELMNDLEAIQHSLNEVDEATVLIQRLHRFPLYFTSDVDLILSLIHKGHVVNVEELLEINKFFDSIKANQIYLDSLIGLGINAPYYQANVESLFYPKATNLRIKEIITPYGEIKDDASSELKSIRKSIRDTEKNIQNKLQELLGKLSSKLTESLISIRNDRYVLPVRADFKNSVPGIIHDQSSSGETVFIEPLAVNELNNKLNSLRENENKEIYKILKTISIEIDEHYELLIENLELLTHLDLVFGKAEYAITINAKKPKINNQGILDLIQCRHPLLNVPNVVANNVSIGKDYQGIIITGPNTGGKTVLLKTVGLLSLMVKMGLLIPCSENSNVMIFDNVFADIGDEQSIDQNLSTFSSHLKNVINILSNVTNHSLVLLDELGSGTDPAEGSSLAIAIFEYLLSKNCLVIATSHYSELKIHAYNSDNIINASVEFNIETLKPTYKLLLGVPGQSNALKISKTLGLPNEIIEAAEKYTYQKNDDNNKVLQKLINQSHELDLKLNMLEQKNQELNDRLKAAEVKRQEAIINRDQIISEAEEEARKLIEKSSKKLNQILQELNEMKLREIKAHEIAEVKHEIKELKSSINIEADSFEEDGEIEVNQSVYVEKYNAYGIIIKKNKNDRYDVQMGNAYVTVDRKFLRVVNNNPDFIKPKSKVTKINVKKDVSSTLDLRGMRYEDAYLKLEKYIDDAIYASLKQVSIIHGFGTGVIRELVINYLKSSPYIESYRFGGAGEGGQGVTIATIKSL